jgi:response regulator RpfG family c-di-GMP phosphodiesterase
VVDDDKRVIELLQIALAGSGYKTFSALNGVDAIDLVEKVRPDVVVLDVRLPKKNGYQVCEALKSNPVTTGIPVIMISGLVEPSARVQGLRCGADDFLTKPFSPKELLLRIQKILGRAADAHTRAIVSAQAEKELLAEQRRMSVAQRRLAQRVERVSAIAEMGRTMVAAGSHDELAGQLIVSLQLCLRAGTVLIAVREGKDSDFKVFKCRGISSRQSQAVPLPAAGELCTRLAAAGKSLTLEELDGVPGMRKEILPLRAAGLAIGMAVDGMEGASALVFTGSGSGAAAFMAEQRQDFESLCKFFGSGLASIQKAEADKASMVDAVEMLVQAVEKARHCRNGHSCRVARFVESMWESLELPPYELQAMRLAALLHEVNGSEKCACSSENDGEDLCSNTVRAGFEAAPGLLSSLRHFRERYDGSGGPLGLRAEQIPLEARILAVADTFDECLCNCESSFPVDEAIQSLRGLAGKTLDPNLVEALVHHIQNGRVKLG